MPVKPDRPHPESEFAVETAIVDYGTTVSVRGDVDAATAPMLQGILAEARARHQRLGLILPVVIDLSRVTFMGASGLAVLVEAARVARRDGCEVALRAASRMTLRLLHLAGLADVFYVERGRGDLAAAVVA